jgi:hypothetical protein
MVVETFGPFVIPVVVFLIGVVFYGLVVLWGRLTDDGESADSADSP